MILASPPRAGLIGLVSLAALLALPQTLSAAVTNPSVHRKLDANGVGNCIFSSQALPFKQESNPAYRNLKTSFSAGEDVHVRCYFGRQLREYESVGKVYNSLRDKQSFYYSLVWVRPSELTANDPDYFVMTGSDKYKPEDRTADQQRFDIEEAPDCDFSLNDVVKQSAYGVTSPHGCINLGAFIRAMAAKDSRLKLPFTATFCVQQHVVAADKEVAYEEWDPALKKKRYGKRRVEYRHLIARSCFQYRIGG